MNKKILFLLVFCSTVLFFIFSVNKLYAEDVECPTEGNTSTCTTTVGEGSTQPPEGNNTPLPITGDLADLISRIRQEFGIIIDCNDKCTLTGVNNVYTALSQLKKSNAYISNLNSLARPLAIRLGQDSWFGPCTGYTRGADLVDIFNPVASGGCSLVTGVEYVVIHELGHVIDKRTDLRTDFRNDGVIDNDGLLKTYPSKKPFKNSESESFAEMMTIYVIYRVKYPSFPQDYPNYYKFARDKIFGGVEY